ncbi:MAG: M1 family metallopeptidase, partial [Polyangiaceae bacterium]|nr:M1 family metallopeptidase [Polyangiaceae bacterium]
MSTREQRLHSNCAGSCAAHFSSAAPGFTLPGTKRKYERSRHFSVTHLALDLELNFESQSVKGSASLDFERRSPQARSFKLDAIGFTISKLELNPQGQKRIQRLKRGESWDYDGDTLNITIPEDVNQGRVIVHYEATPRLGLYFLHPDKKVKDRPIQAWSQCQDEDGRHWFPCQDKPHVKMTSEMKVAVPAGMTVLSGGELIDTEKPKGAKNWTWHYRLDVPAPAYLLTLAVGHFDEWQEELVLESGKSIPLRYLVPPGKKADGRRAFGRTAEIIQLFSKRFGVDYPWKSYSQIVVSDFIFGGMENTTATTMYEHILLDSRATIDIESDDLVAHELAHQWFGDLVTCRDWSHAWLNEGFATYSELVEKEDRLGSDEYEAAVDLDLASYLSEAYGDYQRPIVCRDYDEPIDLFDRHLYQKGGLVLHMLRQKLGTELFWEGVQTYLQKYENGIVETNDLMRTLEEVSGESLESFFDQWVYRPGHPELEVSIRYEEGSLVADIRQTQKGKDVAVFDLLIEVEAHVDGQIIRAQRLMSDRKISLQLPTGSRPDFIVFDPNFRITAPVQLQAPADLLHAALKDAPRARTRRMAARALAKRQDLPTIQALEKSLLAKKESRIVRSEAAESLGKVGAPEAYEALRKAIAISEPRVRRAVAAALRFDHSCQAQLQKLLGDRSYLVSAEAARSLG